MKLNVAGGEATSLSFPPFFFMKDFKYQNDKLNQRYVFMRKRTIAPSPFHTSPLPHISETSFARSVIKIGCTVGEN